MTVVVNENTDELMADERWLPVKNYPAYMVSNLGHVKRLKVPDSLGRNYRPERILKQIFHSGSMNVELFHDGEGRQTSVHTIVLRAFAGEPDDGQIGLHWDDNPKNNNIRNLRWGTYKDNTADAIRNGNLGVGSLAAYKVGLANLGRKRSQESIDLQRSKVIGRKLTKEQCEAIGNRSRGKKCPYMIERNKSRIWTSEAREKIAESNRRRAKHAG